MWSIKCSKIIGSARKLFVVILPTLELYVTRTLTVSESLEESRVDHHDRSFCLIRGPSIDDSRFISGRRSTESGVVPAASIYLHTRDPEIEKKRRDTVVEHLRAPIVEERGGEIVICKREKERTTRHRPRRAGSSTARSLEPQSSRTCLDAPWWLVIRARRCYFFRAATRPSWRVMLGHRPLHAASLHREHIATAVAAATAAPR